MSPVAWSSLSDTVQHGIAIKWLSVSEDHPLNMFRERSFWAAVCHRQQQSDCGCVPPQCCMVCTLCHWPHGSQSWQGDVTMLLLTVLYERKGILKCFIAYIYPCSVSCAVCDASWLWWDREGLKGLLVPLLCHCEKLNWIQHVTEPSIQFEYLSASLAYNVCPHQDQTKTKDTHLLLMISSQPRLIRPLCFVHFPLETAGLHILGLCVHLDCKEGESICSFIFLNHMKPALVS